MKLIYIIFLLLFLFPFFGYSQMAAMDQAAFQQKLESVIAEYQIPGATYAFISGDSILNIAKAGIRKMGHADGITLEDKFHLGSNTKAMTAFVAALLVEQGLIDWDTPFFDVFPEMKNKSRAVYHIMLKTMGEQRTLLYSPILPLLHLPPSSFLIHFRESLQ